MKNKDKSASPVVEESPSLKVPESAKDWGVGRIFWGLLFVVIGGLMLADNFNLVNVNWGDMWRLWPLLIIAAGISILSLHNAVWRIISVFMVVLTLAAIVWVMVGDYSDTQSLKSSESSIIKISNKIAKADVSIKAGATSLSIGSALQDAVVKSKLESNISTVTETSTINGETQQVGLTMNTGSNTKWWMSNIKNIWTIDLTRNLPLRLTVDTGASDTNIDMSKAKLESATIKSGASNLILKLGNVLDVSNISIESGVSSISIQIPSGVGVHLKLEGGLSSKQIADLSKVGDNLYESNDYSQAKKKIYIDSKVGVSSFSIERY